MELFDSRYAVEGLFPTTPPARVFKAHDRLSQQTVVIKGVEASLSSPDAQALRDELERLCAVSHPRVVRAHDFDACLQPTQLTQQPFTYFTEALVDGPDLRALLSRPVTERLSRFAELLEAVSAIHRHGLRCGDLKPENLLLSPAGVTVVDFGLSRDADSLDVAAIPTGTLLYMAPEQLSGQAADPRADLFSLGALLFELLEGRPPFPDTDTPSARLDAWLSLLSPARTLLSPETRATLTEPLLLLLDSLLASSPHDRPATAAEALRQLLAVDWPGLSFQPTPLVADLPRGRLVGRDALLDALERFLTLAGKAGRVAVLSGDLGVGRSRVLETLALRVFQALPGRCVRLELARLPEQTQESIRHWLASGESLPHAPGWLLAFEQEVSAAAAENGWRLLVLDDFDGPVPAPRAGLRLALGLKPGLPEPRIAPVETDRRHWRLTGLDAPAVTSLAEQLTGQTPSAQRVQHLLAFSGGNPGVLRVALAHGPALETSDVDLARDLAPLLQAAFPTLGADLATRAAPLSLFLQAFTLEVAAVALEMPKEQVGPLCQTLVEGGLLTVNPAEAGRYSFPLGAVQTWLRGGLEIGRRMEVHRRIGRFLERRQQLGASIPTVVLAWHFEQGQDAERARRYLGRAFREAVSKEDSWEVTGLGTRLLRWLPPGEPERTHVLDQLSACYLTLQQYESAQQACLEALESLEEDDDDPLLVHHRRVLLVRLARSLEARGDFAQARGRYEQALLLVGNALEEPDFTAESGRIKLALARIYHREGLLTQAREVLAQARALLAESSSQAEQVEALLLEGLICLDAGELGLAEAAFQGVLARADQGSQPGPRMRALHNLHLLAVRRGNLLEGVGFLQKALELAEEAGEVSRLGAGFNNLGNLQRRLGDDRKALRSYRRALRIFERLGDQAGLGTVSYSLANLLHERGEHARALEELERAERLAGSVGGGFEEQTRRRTRLVRGEVLLALGRLEEAYPLLEAALEDAQQREDADTALVAELALAELGLARGDTAEVERRCRDLGRGDGSGREQSTFQRTLSRLHHHLGHHYAGLYLERSRQRGPDVLGPALLEAALNALPPSQPQTLRAQLEESILHLEAAGRGHLAAKGRQLLLELGSGPGERLSLLRGVMDVLQSLGDRKRVLAYLVSLAAQVLRAERGLLLYRRAAGELVEFSALHGMNLGEAQRVSGEIVRRVAEQNEAVVVEDALEDPSFVGSASIHDLQIRSVLGLPIDRDEQGMWILYLDHRRLPGVFSLEAKPLLERLSQLASGLLKEIRWRESLLARVESKETDHRRYGMVGVSRAIERVREYIDNLGHLKLNNENLLFIGESGTGKELVARAVHKVLGAGRDIPFIAQSCADIPAELIESTLFGHRRGAFTSAREDRPGIFELANGGVLFLDEIGDLPLHLQASLLRVLEERTVSRVGEPEKPRALSLIVVFATNRDLAREVEAGRFRRDLFHRLNQVFRLPPLRERREDILPLLVHFMSQIEDFRGMNPEELFDPEVLLWFHEYGFPGNIRELRNMVEAIPVRIKARRRERVTLEDLGERPVSHTVESVVEQPLTGETLRDFTERMEQGYIRRVMEQSGWDITTAAARLGLTYQGLRKRVIRYDWMQEVDRHRGDRGAPEGRR